MWVNCHSALFALLGQSTPRMRRAQSYMYLFPLSAGCLGRPRLGWKWPEDQLAELSGQNRESCQPGINYFNAEDALKILQKEM